MSAEEQFEQEFVEEADEFLEHEEILDEYRRRQMIEHLTGPMISLLLHAVVVVACAVLLVGREVRDDSGFEFNTKELEVKPLDPETLDELDELEDEPLDEVVPTVEKPTITPESMDVETPDFSDALAATEMDLDLAALDLKMTTSPITLPGLYRNRTAEGRRKALDKYAARGMAGPTERAVLKALRWLKEHQEEDGSWSPKEYPEAMTGLALLAFLAHGETPASEEFGATVQTAIQWLANRMLSKGAKLEHRGYSHGIATYALGEAYGLTKIPFVKPAMETGLNRIVTGQQPRGGFNYGYEKGERWDLSVSAWQFQAMKAGYVAGAGVPGLEDAMLKGIEFIKNVAYKDGKFGYSSAGGGRLAMTAAGTLALQLLGEGDCSEAKNAVQTMADLRARWKGNDFSHGATYGWYYATQAMFHAGKSTFSKWNAEFAPLIIKTQAEDGHWDSPPGDSHSGKPMEPYYNTAMNALSLQVYYRYLPTYQEPTKVASAPEDIFEFDENEL